jgi:hypothetical protein
MGFANSAILTLGIADSTRRVYIDRIADTIGRDGVHTVSTDSVRRKEAIALLQNHPEIIPELRGDSLTTQNPDIPYAKIIKDIRKDSTWLAALEAQAFLRTASMNQMLHAEVDHLKAGKPLYKDQAEEIGFSLFCQQKVKELMEKMRNSEKSMAIVKEKAEKNHKTLEKALEDDARWLIRRKYKLDLCRLIDDPDAAIPIPLDFQLN